MTVIFFFILYYTVVNYTEVIKHAISDCLSLQTLITNTHITITAAHYIFIMTHDNMFSDKKLC